MGEVDESLVDDYDPSLYNGLEVVDSEEYMMVIMTITIRMMIVICLKFLYMKA